MFLAAVHHPVEPAGELEDVLGLERGRGTPLRERQGRSSRLRVVGEVLALAGTRGPRPSRRRRPIRRARRARHGRGVGLCPKLAPSTSGVRGRNQRRRAHARPVQTRASDGAEHVRTPGASGEPSESDLSATIVQRTWCQRRRPPPTPTIEEATTCVVETGAPIAEAARSTRGRGALASAKPSIGRRRKIRRPIVRTIRQPPSAVPDRQRRAADQLHPESARVSVCRRGRRRAAAPRSRPSTSGRRWRRGRTPALPTSPTARARSARRQRARRPAPGRRRSPRMARSPRATPSDGEIARRDQHTERRRPGASRSSPPQVDGADAPHRRSAGADEAADQRVPGARGQPAPPGEQVPRHGRRERRRRSPRRPRWPWTVTIAAIGVGDRRAERAARRAC